LSYIYRLFKRLLVITTSVDAPENGRPPCDVKKDGKV
jgi:hypothetical protein